MKKLVFLVLLVLLASGCLFESSQEGVESTTTTSTTIPRPAGPSNMPWMSGNDSAAFEVKADLTRLTDEGVLEAAFRNTAGAGVTVRRVSVWHPLVGGLICGRAPDLFVGNRDFFLVDLDGCGSWEAYSDFDVEMRFEYEMRLGDVVRERNASVRVSGVVEESHERFSPQVEVRSSILECEKLQATYDRDNCLRREAYRLNDSSICGRLSNFWIDECVRNTAKKPSDCKKLEDEGLRRDCIIGFLYSRNDSSACGELEDQLEVEECFFDFAKYVNDSSPCLQIVNETNRMYCVGVVSLDKDVCHNLSGSYKNHCLLNYAVGRMDEAVCNEIGDSDVYKYCRRQVFSRFKTSNLLS